MKRIFALAVCLVFLSVAVPAQDDAAYENLMEAGNQRTGALALHLQGKDGAAALEDSKLLETVFGQIAAFFEKRKAADAVEFAKNVQAGFKEAGELANSGKFPEALEKFQETRANCDGCHKAHRERTPEGDWKIK